MNSSEKGVQVFPWASTLAGRYNRPVSGQNLTERFPGALQHLRSVRFPGAPPGLPNEGYMPETLTIEFTIPALTSFIEALNMAYAGKIHFEAVEYAPGKANIAGHLISQGPTMLTVGNGEPREIAPAISAREGWTAKDYLADAGVGQFPIAGENPATAESSEAPAEEDEPAPRAGSGDVAPCLCTGEVPCNCSCLDAERCAC